MRHSPISLHQLFVCIYVASPCSLDELYIVQWSALHGLVW
jgi:hypothetical protein